MKNSVPFVSGAAFAVVLASLVSVQADCTLTNTGKIPLNESTTTYSNFWGGLYGTNLNNRPVAHFNAGMQIATNQIVPLNTNGVPNSTTGKIVMLSIGMSNTTQEWATKGQSNFTALANPDPSKNSKVVIVDGAQGGQDATKWTNLNASTWSNVVVRLSNAGLTTNQVQVIWIKQALAGPQSYGAFPAHAQELQKDLEIIVRNCKKRFPKARIAFVSGRTRAYTTLNLNPEPYAYESSFATKWMMEKQISGNTSLSFQGTNAVAPYLSWGPYLWIDGLRTRSDGAIWRCNYLESDFTHPNTNGVAVVAKQLLAFFKTDPTSTSWFLKANGANAPVPTFVGNPTTISAGTLIRFTATVNDPDSNIRDYSWSFDDGDYVYTRSSAGTLSQDKIFYVPGTYRVRLTVTDNSGNNGKTSSIITVTP